MAILIGIDEAGYGPNLGPLVVGFTAWQTENVTSDLYQILGEAVSRRNRPGRITVCDSKLAGGLAGLEPAVLAACAQLPAGLPGSWPELQARQLALPVRLPIETDAEQGTLWEPDLAPLSAGPEERRSQASRADRWTCDEFPMALPRDACAAGISSLATHLQEVLSKTGCGLAGAGFAVVHADRFNQLLDRHGNKSRLLGTVSMEVVRQALASCPVDEPVHVVCDRQGGRQRYLPLLKAAFPSHCVRVTAECPSSSAYSLRAGGPLPAGSPAGEPAPGDFRSSALPLQFTVEFRVGGESVLPVAWASMFAKYVRELAMCEWNHHWKTRIDGIQPTAGYPVDAIRFRRVLRQHFSADELPDSVFWRKR